MPNNKPQAVKVDKLRYSFHLDRDLKIAANNIALETGRTTGSMINVLIREAIQYRKVKI